jgi:AcrR family transcriptional regulator
MGTIGADPMSTPNDDSVRLDPRVKRTRQLLDQAFIDLVKEKGFQAISVQDITGRAGVNRATFYAHFQDKYALLDYSVRTKFRQEIASRMLNSCQFSLDNLRMLIVAVCEFVSRSHTDCAPPQGQFDALIETQIKTQVYELLLKWLGQGGNPGASPEMVATATSWAIYGLAVQWGRQKPAQPVEEYAGQALPLIAANLQAGKAVQSGRGN